MLTHPITSPSPWLFFEVWADEHLNPFFSYFNIDTTIFSKRLIKNNNFMIESLNKKREQARILTPDIAKIKLKKIKHEIKTYEHIEEYVSGSSNVALKNSFHILVKTAYKYEARLNKIAYSDKPVIKTPENIKEVFSEMGKESLRSHLESNNAF